MALLDKFMEQPSTILGLSVLGNADNPAQALLAGQSLLQRQAQQRSALESDALQRQLMEQQILRNQQQQKLEADRQDAMRSIFQRTPLTGATAQQMVSGQIPPTTQSMFEQDPDAARMALAQVDPTVARSMLGTSKAAPYFQQIPGSSGVLSVNTRTNEMAFQPYPPQFGGPVAHDPYQQQQVAYGKGMGSGAAKLITEPAIERETTLARAGAEKQIEQPKREADLSAREAKTSMLDSTIDQALDQSNMWTTGFIGSATSWVPGTPAHNLSMTLNTLKANAGFDKLAEMKATSPTGGALGQVSDRENTLLQQAWTSVEQSQSQSQFEDNLEKFRTQVKQSWDRVRSAYKRDYGVEYEGASIGPAPDDVPEDIWNVMTPEERALWQ